MANGSDGADVSPESEAAAAAAAEKGGEIWGTLEELLLACAVTRHGTASWDSVAMEVQTRCPLAARPGLTPHSCRLRFRHLHRRFTAAGTGGEDDPDASAAEGWVDELRRLRVAELRRDVERCDLSIGYGIRKGPHKVVRASSPPPARLGFGVGVGVGGLGFSPLPALEGNRRRKAGPAEVAGAVAVEACWAG